MGGGTGGGLTGAATNPHEQSEFSELELSLDTVVEKDKRELDGRTRNLSYGDRRFIEGVQTCYENMVYDAEGVIGVGFGISSPTIGDVTQAWFHPDGVYDLVDDYEVMQCRLAVTPGPEKTSVNHHRIRDGLLSGTETDADYWQDTLERVWRGRDHHDYRDRFSVLEADWAPQGSLDVIVYSDEAH